jgi:hypothetical protein
VVATVARACPDAPSHGAEDEGDAVGNHRPAPSHVVVAITRAPPDLPSHGAKDEGTAVDVGGKEELEVLTLRLLWW